MFPPFLCWCLARVRQPMTQEQLKEYWRKRPRALLRKQNQRRQLTGQRRPKKTFYRQMTQHEVATASGLSFATVHRICARTNWNDVRVEDALAFMNACGVNVMHLRKNTYWCRIRHIPPEKLFLHLHKKRLNWLTGMVKKASCVAASKPQPMNGTM